jgi:hypothetical protein
MSIFAMSKSLTATRLLVAVLFTFGCLRTVHAQNTSTEFEKVLLPVTNATPQPGAFGSRWVTVVRVTNPLSSPVSAYGWLPSNFGLPIVDPLAVFPLPASTTLAPSLREGSGTFLFIDKQFVDEIQVTVRAQDLSRQSQTWGTLIPTPREREFVSRSFSLNDIPTDPRFRSTIRVYSFDGSVPALVKITVYGVANDNPPNMRRDTDLGSTIFALTDVSTVPSPTNVLTPGFLQLSSLDAIASTAGFDRVRVDIEPVEAGSRLWAFASITNNETQHITIVAPSF